MPIRDIRGRIGRGRRLRLTNGGGSHPNLPGKPFPGTSRGNIPPIIDTIDDPQTDLTSRQHLNRVQAPPPTELRGTVAGRNEPVPDLLGKFRTHGKFLLIDYNVENQWVWVFGFGERINQPTKVVVNGKDYTFTSQGDGRWFADIDGGGLWVYDGTQDYIDFRLQKVRIPDGANPPIQYTQTHEGDCYGVLQMANPSDWPEVVLIGEGSPLVRIDGLSDTRGYTTNPAWLTAYIIEKYTTLDIDWPSVGVCADYCDETINGIKRSEIGIAINRKEYINDWVAVLREYGYLYALNNGETVRFVCDRARASVMDIGSNDIDIGQTSWAKGNLNARPENVKVTWLDFDTGVEGETYALDQASDLEDEYYMPAFLHEQQANMWATRRFNKMTIRDFSGVVAINARGLALDFGDVITVTDTRFSAISSKKMEVLETRATSPGKTVAKLIEYQENTYTDAPQSQPQTPDTTLPDPFDYPSSLVFTSNESSVDVQQNGDVTHVSTISWEAPEDFPYITGYHVVAGGYGASGVVYLDAVFPPETTSVQVTGADPQSEQQFGGPFGCYVTILTAVRPNRVITTPITSNDFNIGLLKDAANGVYWLGYGIGDDPTPPAVTNVNVLVGTSAIASVVNWRYDRRPNYVRRFRVEIINTTDTTTEATLYTSGRSLIVPTSVFSSDLGDTFRADVYAENRNPTPDSSTVSSSSTFVVS